MADEAIKVAEASARGSFYLISGTALSTVILAVGSILIARLLGPELYGQYTLALVTPQLLYIFTDLGINQGIIKYTANLLKEGESSRIAKMIKYGLILRASIGIVIFIANYAFADFFASVLLQRPDLGFYIRIASISLLFQVMFTTATSAFVGLDKTEYNALITNTQSVAKTIISIALVIFGFSVVGAILGNVASDIAGAIIGGIILFFVIYKNRASQNTHNALDDLKTLLYYGAPLYVSLLLAGFLPLYQSFMLAIFTTDIDIGNSRAAGNFIVLLAVISGPIATALLPAFSKLESSVIETLRSFFKLATKYTTIIMIPTVTLLIILSNDIIRVLYGTTYQSAPLFLSANCISYLLVGLGYLTIGSFYNGIGETKFTLKVSIVTFVLVIVLSPFLTKTYSVIGLILASLIANVVATVYAALNAVRKYQIKFGFNSILRIYVASIIAAAPVVLMLQLSFLPSILTLIIGATIYLAIYITAIPLTGAITDYELKTLDQITQKVRILRVIAKPILTYAQKLTRKKNTRLADVSKID